MQKIAALALCLALGACAGDAVPEVPQLNVQRVISSAPYRYIHYSKTDDPRTIKEIRNHNYRHSLVKKAEAEAGK